jgi:hypothetical protein
MTDFIIGMIVGAVGFAVFALHFTKKVKPKTEAKAHVTTATLDMSAKPVVDETYQSAVARFLES